MSRRWIALLVVIGSSLVACGGGQDDIGQLVEEAKLERRRVARESDRRTAQTQPAPTGDAQAPGASPTTNPPAPTTSTSSTTTGPPPTRAAAVPKSCSQPVDLGPIVLPAPERTFPAILNGVSIARQPCFERVVFSFKDGFPATGYKVSYEPGPFRSKKGGQTVPIEGRQFLVVRIEPGKGEGVYDLDGQDKIASDPVNPPDGRAKVFQVRGLGGFGSAVVWIIGLDTRRAFRIGRQDSPPQLVVDF